MQIWINHTLIDVPSNCTLEQAMPTVFKHQQSQTKNAMKTEQAWREGVAVAVNNTVIPKVKWAKHLLEPHAKVHVFHAIAGG
ncbi:sulfur carrier protein ThiS [Flocculibacter collagenilyticus]|uniref:sulfur carrier protein ThiS n=1 Tax=Flocculibacter collagenilyticus TaxID=2744479 RepID=UPI0018F2FDE4|nr:sulfur carrier protein ThiS [Flocculibacter collagenilyticus]